MWVKVDQTIIGDSCLLWFNFKCLGTYDNNSVLQKILYQGSTMIKITLLQCNLHILVNNFFGQKIKITKLKKGGFHMHS